MSVTDYKKEIKPVDGTPVKRMFLSIISDYDLKTALCELVDNALDQWSLGKTNPAPTIELSLDADRQLISVRDNSGGVSHDDLHLLIAPGRSRNNPTDPVIGIFGVGGKRAAIALAEYVEIKTRYRDQQTHELDINPVWIASDDWRLPAYEIPNIDPGTTEVGLSHLRSQLTVEQIDLLRVHLGQTYDWFIRKGCIIKLNGDPVSPIDFESWAFPPGHSPQKIPVTVDVKGAGKISFEVTAGLIRDRNPEEENYGVYFYCNHRLIVKEVKSREVGYFVSAESGVPHPDISHCRTMVRIEGPAEGMPWTSKKDAINFDHPVFQCLASTVIEATAHFSKLSRRLSDDWSRNVVQYETGTIEVAQPTDKASGRRLILPALPRETRPRGVRQKRLNQAQTQQQPWTLGLVEAIDAVELVERSPLETKNRIALILLDSNFEISLKEFIVHRQDLFPPHEYNDLKLLQLIGNRTVVIRTVRSKIPLPDSTIDIVNHYYNLRNKLAHERATVEVSDRDIQIFRGAVEEVLNRLFNLQFE
jgi:hypothetical protein